MRTKYFSLGDLAKACEKEGLKIKGPALIDWLVKYGYLRREEGKTFTLPTDISYMEHLMTFEKIRINNYVHVKAVVTEKGMEFFIDQLKKHYRVPAKLF